MADISCPACTFNNNHYLAFCELCESPLTSTSTTSTSSMPTTSFTQPLDYDSDIISVNSSDAGLYPSDASIDSTQSTLTYLIPPSPTVSLGPNNPIFAYGVGTLPLGVTYSGTGRPSPSASASLLSYAVESGVEFVDTADSYFEGGDNAEIGYVERIIGKLQQAPACIGTKAGMHRVNSLSTGWRPVTFSPETLRNTVLNQRRNLGCETIPMWSFHHVDSYGTGDGEDGLYMALLGEVKKLVQEGVIERVGLCNATVKHIEKARGVVDVVAVQNEFSLWDRAASNPLSPPVGSKRKLGKNSKLGTLQYCVDNGIAFFPYGALGGHDARMSRVSLEKDFPALLNLAKEKGVSLHQLVLAWMRQKYPNIVHIVGCRTKERVDELVRLGKTDGMVLFTQEEVDFIDELKPGKK